MSEEKLNFIQSFLFYFYLYFLYLSQTCASKINLQYYRTSVDQLFLRDLVDMKKAKWIEEFYYYFFYFF